MDKIYLGESQAKIYTIQFYHSYVLNQNKIEFPLERKNTIWRYDDKIRKEQNKKIMRACTLIRKFEYYYLDKQYMSL